MRGVCGVKNLGLLGLSPSMVPTIATVGTIGDWSGWFKMRFDDAYGTFGWMFYKNMNLNDQHKEGIAKQLKIIANFRLK